MRKSTFSLPKLLSVLDDLEPSQKLLMQTLLVNLPASTVRDLGCYFYLVRLVCRTQVFDHRSSEISSSSNIFEQWHRLELSTTLFVCKQIGLAYSVDKAALISSVSSVFHGNADDAKLLSYASQDIRSISGVRDILYFLTSVFPGLLARVLARSQKDRIDARWSVQVIYRGCLVWRLQPSFVGPLVLGLAQRSYSPPRSIFSSEKNGGQRQRF
jgi:hypothetical protein